MSQQQNIVDNCQTFGQFVQRVCHMTSNNEAVAFEGVVRSRRDACTFILEQRDTYAPPALSASAVAKIWTQLGCTVDVSRVTSAEAAKRLAASNNTNSNTNNAKRVEERRAKTGALPSSQTVQSLESVVTSIEWGSVNVCGKKLNAGGCYVNALELDPQCNAAAWFNLGCWLSSETKEVVKGNARAMAMVKAEEDEERRNTAISRRGGPANNVRRYGIPKGVAPPGGRPPIPASAATANGTAAAVPTAAGASPNGGDASAASGGGGDLIILPAAIIRRKEYSAALCFAQAVAVDDQLQGGWLNLGAALALEQLLEKRGAIPQNRAPITIEGIEEIRAKIRSDGNHNIGYNAAPKLVKTVTKKNGVEVSSPSSPSSSQKSGKVTRQFCYIKELEANLRAASKELSAAAAVDSPASSSSPQASHVPPTTENNANLIGPSSLSSPYYLSNHPDAINSVTFTDSCPSSDEEKAKTKKIRHERRVNRYRQLAITADARGPSRATVRALAWVNLAATFENSTDSVTIIVRDFHVPFSHSEIGGKYIRPDAPIRIQLTKRQCLEAAIAEDGTIAKAWLNLGATMEDNDEILYAPKAATASSSSVAVAGSPKGALSPSAGPQRINRLQCFVKALDVSNDSNPILWMNIAVILFDDMKAEGKTSREHGQRVTLRSRRRINGQSGNITVYQQRQAIMDERAERRRARQAAAETAALLAIQQQHQQNGGGGGLSKAQLDRLNALNPNTNLSARRSANKNIFGVVDYDDDDEEDDGPIGVFGATFDCIDCMEEYLSRVPDDGKAWLQLAHMFQYFIEGLGVREKANTAAGPADGGAAVGAVATVSPTNGGAGGSAAAPTPSDDNDDAPPVPAAAVVPEGGKKATTNKNVAPTDANTRKKQAVKQEDEGMEEEEVEEIEEVEELEEHEEAVEYIVEEDEEVAELLEEVEEVEEVAEEEEHDADNGAVGAASAAAVAAATTPQPASPAVAAEPLPPIPCALVVAGYRYTTPREVFAEVARCDPSNGEVWFTLGNYLYYDPDNKDGSMLIRIGRSRRAEQLTYKECYSKAQSLGAMSRFACCTIM